MKLYKVMVLIILFIAIACIGGGVIFYMNNASNSVTVFDVTSLSYSITEKDFSKIFKDVEGSFVVYDTNRNKYIVYNKEEALQQMNPGDTFGIFSTLIGLEEGKLKDAANLKNIKETSKMIDKAILEKYIKAANYGNSNISSSNFWIKTLKISPIEQVEFLRKIYAGEMKFTGGSIMAVKQAMLLGNVRNGVLYGIYDQTKKDMITYVGNYEKRGNTYIYAARMKGENMDEAIARDIVEKTLNNIDKEIANGKISKTMVLYEVPNMSRVQAKKNITYKTYGNNQKLGFDIYYPLNNAEGKKAYPLIMIHGAAGIPSLKDSGAYNSWGRIGAASGYATIVFNWRAWDRKSADANAEDIADAIKYIREHAEDLNINPDHMSVFAFSAGVNQGIRKTLEVDTGFVDSIVEYYGELPLEVLDKADGKKLPPMFLADAAYDDMINKKINEEFFNKATSMNYQITRVVHENGGHGFEVFDDNMTTYEIIKKSLEFVEANRKDK